MSRLELRTLTEIYTRPPRLISRPKLHRKDNMSVTNTFSPNTRAKSSEVNQNFTDVWPTDWTPYTPVISGAGVPGLGTYTLQKGEYMQLAKMVWFSFGLTITNHTGNGDMEISLPVVAGTFEGNNKFNFTVRIINLDIGAAAQDLAANITSGEDFFTIAENRDNAATVIVDIDTACSIFGSGFYKVD